MVRSSGLSDHTPRSKMNEANEDEDRESGSKLKCLQSIFAF